MLGGLYGDLPPPSAAADDECAGKSTGISVNGPLGASVWSNTKLAPRKPSFSVPPSSVLRNHSTVTKQKAPPVLVDSRWISANNVAASPDRPQSPPVTHYAALVAVSSRVLEEYDPARPNDYDEHCRERRRRKVEEVRMEVERRREEEEREDAVRLTEMEREKEQGREQRVDLRVSGEEAWKRRAMLSTARDTSFTARACSSSPPKGSDGFCASKQSSMTAAQRMMARMGWKEGQGLGKQEQGITVPLIARKTDKRAGVIVNVAQSAAVYEKKSAVKGVSISGMPTRVVLLRNMVCVLLSSLLYQVA